MKTRFWNLKPNYMTKRYIYIATLLLLFSGLNISAQQMLTKHDALRIVMENNFDVVLSEEQLKIAETNTSIFNSGYLPTLSGNAGITYNIDNLNVERQDGSVIETTNAKSDSHNAGLNLNYVLFNGFSRKYNLERNKELLNQGQLNMRATLEATILTLFQSYYGVARSQHNVENLQETLVISKERLRRMQYGYEYGRNSRLDVSNAEVDVNTDSINLLNAKQNLANSKRDLNFILGQPANTVINVDTTLQFNGLVNRDELHASMQTESVQILIANSNIAANRSATKATQGGYYPSLSLNGSYSYRRGNNNDASFTAANTSSGFSYGASLSWNLFDGGSTRTNEQVAKINENISQIGLEQTKNQLEVDFENAWGDYQNKLFVVQAQEANLQTNRQNFERSVEQYKLGQLTSIDFRTAQRNLLTAEVSLTQAKYDAKIAELVLLQLAGRIQEADF